MQTVTIKSQFMAKRSDLYSALVFKNLDEEESSYGRYIIVTMLPNWHAITPQEGDEGFLTYEVAKAGDSYYKSTTGEWDKYKYDGQYFLSFLPVTATNKQQTYEF